MSIGASNSARSFKEQIMRIALPTTAVCVLLASLPAFAQSQATTLAVPPMKNMATAADVRALIAKAKSERKKGDTYKGETIVQIAPYNVSLEYRVLPVPPAIHEKQAELFYVLQGSGTLTVGGKLTDEKRTSPGNLGGTAIVGGAKYSLTKGDFYFVAEGLPHMWTPVGGPIVTMSLHLAHPVPAG
jgi:mannose-6-phosphate isomerase-like protein (cupin superfamily)